VQGINELFFHTDLTSTADGAIGNVSRREKRKAQDIDLGSRHHEMLPEQGI